jgi:hypothetical protein
MTAEKAENYPCFQLELDTFSTAPVAWSSYEQTCLFTKKQVSMRKLLFIVNDKKEKYFSSYSMRFRVMN